MPSNSAQFINGQFVIDENQYRVVTYKVSFNGNTGSVRFWLSSKSDGGFGKVLMRVTCKAVTIVLISGRVKQDALLSAVVCKVRLIFTAEAHKSAEQLHGIFSRVVLRDA